VKSIFIAALALVMSGCAYKQPTHSVKVYIVETDTPKITAIDRDDVGCKSYGFCGEFAYRLETSKHICYGPDYNVDVLNDPQKRCYVPSTNQ
jgi:hypothetical protein